MRSRNVGICHSDFELYEGRYIIPVSYPIIPGHEWSGEIAEVGSARRRRCAPGDRVVGECVVNNGDDHFGFSISGADAEYFVAKASWLHRIPEELSFTPGRVRRAVLGRLQRLRRRGRDRRERRGRRDRRRADRPPLRAWRRPTMGGSVTLIEPQAHRRALGARDRREARDRPERRAARRAGRRGDRRTRVRRRDRGRRRSGRDGERLPDRGARRRASCSSASTSAAARRSRSGSCSRRRSRCAGSSARPGCGRARSASWRRAASTRRRSLTATFPLGEGTAALDAARDTSRNVKVQIEC